VVSGTFTIPLNAENHAEQLDRLDQAFILRSFIGGHENELVRWSLEELSDPTSEVNPLTFYGPTSTGKTTLLSGLEHCWTEATGESALLTNGVDFDRAFAYALETGTVAEFRDKFRRHGLVIIDDLHLLNDKPAVQQEFTNLLDWRIEAGAPLVLALDASPIELTGLSECLVSRLAGGILIPLQLPTPNTRRAILDQLLKQANLDFPVVVREAIAGQCPALASPFCTVPEIRHAILELQHKAEDTSSPPSLDDVTSLINRELGARKPTLNQIAKKVARHFNVRTKDLKSASRRQWVVRARGIVVYLARELTDDSFQRLGQLLGGRDHSTVMHACRSTESLIESDPGVAAAVDRLRREIVGDTNNAAKMKMPEHRSSGKVF
jgi:chromosomal replication initiator protein